MWTLALYTDCASSLRCVMRKSKWENLARASCVLFRKNGVFSTSPLRFTVAVINFPNLDLRLTADEARRRVSRMSCNAARWCKLEDSESWFSFGIKTAIVCKVTQLKTFCVTSNCVFFSCRVLLRGLNVGILEYLTSVHCICNSLLYMTWPSYWCAFTDYQKLEREARICRMLKHPTIGKWFQKCILWVFA
jgi:hypothetical protein